MRMSLTVITMSITFIVFTLPNAIAGGYFIDELFKSETGPIILYVTDCFAFSFHALNFVTLLILNNNFRKEFRDFVTEKFGKKRIHPSTTTGAKSIKTNDTSKL